MTESEKVLVDELPLAIVRRVVKNKLSECSPEYDVSIHKEAILAFSEGARIFIPYLSATANDNCKDSRRQTMKAEDVFKAIEDMGFEDFSEPLKASLEDFKKKNAGKKAGGGEGAASSSKPKETGKRKQEGASMQKGVRKCKSDEGGKKNDENDNTEENVNDEDDGTEENGNGEEDDEEGNEENMEEEFGSGEHDEKESGDEKEADNKEEDE
ncbi:hypothetical protein F2Q69_00002449 [Brassica cretica]|uniref:Transcription factor CBF/NF-Y/archaeal histone domain-containing protein n=1 Tax=Brassica cretica TaxID=69181 RepID=A0A8S9PFT3_BRACR|nr:hypothetical protein F2Q69_00002449 [Brassica cretica]